MVPFTSTACPSPLICRPWGGPTRRLTVVVRPRALAGLHPTPCGSARVAVPPRPSWSAHNVKQRREVSVAAAKPATTTAAAGTGRPSALVIGGGWAGFGAAWRLSQLGFDVELLDASETPGGLATGWRTKAGRAVEAGIKGFWYHYKNIDALVADLGIRPSPFTEYTSSAFWDTEGVQVTAPIFQSLPRLPTPLGSFLYTSPYFTSLSVADRLTALPLIRALLEFDLDEVTFSQYDRMSARELFLGAGVSDKLYSSFLEPVLLALLFVPLEQLSAATALAVLYNYVLAHQPDFDVRWARGSISELIFLPWIKRMEEQGVTVRGGMRITGLLTTREGTGVVANGVIAETSAGDVQELEADYVVLALGVKALQGVARSTPDVANIDMFRRLNNFEGVSVMAVRLWFDRRLPMASPSNVLSGVDPGVGGTFYDLNALQDEYRNEPGSVIEVDLYNAAYFMGMTDDQVVDEIQHRYLSRFLPKARTAVLLDYSVIKVPNGVTKFSPGSYQWMPTTKTPVSNLFLAGDHISHGPGAHGARGLSQEKALVTGYLAALACAEDARVPCHASAKPLDVEPDESHITAARELLRASRRGGIVR